LSTSLSASSTISGLFGSSPSRPIASAVRSAVAPFGLATPHSSRIERTKVLRFQLSPTSTRIARV